MRITRAQMYMQIAEVVSRRSTCCRRAVGAILVGDKRILGEGYNGPIADQPHCDNECRSSGRMGCTRAVHAEMNALMKLVAPFPHDLDLYVTESPCVVCAARIIDPVYTIRRVFYQHPYRLSDGLDLIRDGSDISLFQITASGYVVDIRTDQLVTYSV